MNGMREQRLRKQARGWEAKDSTPQIEMMTCYGLDVFDLVSPSKLDRSKRELQASFIRLGDIVSLAFGPRRTTQRKRQTSE
jgi:hypothetical protein